MTRMSERAIRMGLLWLSVAGASLLPGRGRAQEPKPPTATAAPPNMLVILVDDLGYGDLGCYGATDLVTPHVDALFAAGLTMTNFLRQLPGLFADPSVAC